MLQRHCLVLFGALLFAACTFTAPLRDSYVIVISMDGLSPAHYLQAGQHGYRLTNLRILMQTGVYSRGAVSVYPSLTYPAHASMMTGVPPRDHGILANSYYFNDSLQPVISGRLYRRDPVWRLLHRAGFTIGSVFWPVTADEPIHWLLPEAWWDEDKGNDEVRLQKEAAISTPGLIDSLRHFIGAPLNRYFESDTVKTDAAIYLLTRFRPNLLLLHYSHLDYMQHLHGRFSPQAIDALMMQDTQIGRLIRTTQEMGIFDKTTFLIVSDHGHAAIRYVLHPGILLRRAGLVQVDTAGQLLSWQAMAIPSGGSCSIVLSDASDKKLSARIVSLFADAPDSLMQGIERMFLPHQIDSLGGNPQAVLMLEARPGYAFGGKLNGSLVQPAEGYRSTHGYLPHKPEMHAGFIIAGRRIKPAGQIPTLKITDIAPLILALFGLYDSDDLPKPLSRILTD